MDHPERVAALAVLDGLPHIEQVERVDARFATQWWHWFFFAGSPHAERVITADPDAWYGLGAQAKEDMGAGNFEYVSAALHDPLTVRAMLEDYRAGMGIDLEHDRQDRARGRRIQCPTLVAWSIQDDMEDLYGDLVPLLAALGQRADHLGQDRQRPPHGRAEPGTARTRAVRLPAPVGGGDVALPPVVPARRVRETASMTAEYAQSDQFRGARIHPCELAGLEIRDCEVSGLKVVDCYGSDVYLGGDFERVVVNDVDVTAYVEAELDRQHPHAGLAREATSPDDYRAAWDAIETLWAATLDRARRLPEAKLHEQVDGEWSFVETQRHLLFGSDAWLGNAVLEEEAPYHPLGFPYGGMPADAAAKLGLTLEATPTLDEVLAPRLRRMATMRRVVDGPHRGRARPHLRSQAGGAVSRPGVRRPPLSQGGAQGRGRAPPLCRARPRRARGRSAGRVSIALNRHQVRVASARARLAPGRRHWRITAGFATLHTGLARYGRGHHATPDHHHR